MATPLHLWLVGGASLLWNAGGALDYVMTQSRNPAWMATFTPGQTAWLYGLPRLAVACWALGVWGAVAGSLLLLGRSRLSPWAFAISLSGMAGLSLWHLVFAPVPLTETPVPAPLAFSVAVLVIGVAQLWYAREMVRRGLA
jgi:hypothetical protein